jgi:hypothetical protein
MTYRELLAQLQQLTDEQLDSTVTVYDTDSDEYYGCIELVYTEPWTDVLDPNHPVISF